MAGPSPSCQPRASVAGNTFIPSLPKKVLGAALGAVVAGLALTGGQAKALVVNVNVGGLDYDVTTFTGSYADNVSKFTATDMPWWGGDDTLAKSFASAVGRSSGLDGNYGGALGPFFAYGVGTDFFGEFIRFAMVNADNLTVTSGTDKTVPWTFATATLDPSSPAATSSTASVPGPLPILGLAAAFGFSRKLRNRINLHKGISAVPTSPGA